MEFILSDGKSTNSKGYRVAVAGIRMERFSVNPVMLKEHNPDLVIGRWENWMKENNQLKAQPVFDKDDPEGKEVARKVDNNFLRCASIGIIPLKLEYIDDEFVMAECELVEASIVSIPSDAGAVRLYNEKLEELSFDQVKINFNFNNNQKQNQMAEVVFKLSHKTVESLKLDADYTPKDVELAVAEKDREIEKLNAD
jgi:HK97 family phage prohead protease